MPEAPAPLPALLEIPEEAVEEWARAAAFEEVRSCRGRLGGHTTLHRYGRGHFSELAKASRLRS